MKLVDLANEFADLNVFNSYTHKRLIGVAKIFTKRVEITDVEEITLKSIIEFKSKTLMFAKPVSYNGYLKYLRIIGDYAVKQRLLDRNLFRDVKLAPIGVTPKKTMDDNDIRSIHQYLLKNQHQHRPAWFWIAVMYTLYYTGIRRRQLVNLKMKDLDLTEKTILLNYKSSKTLREWQIPMHDELVELLKNVIQRTEKALGRQLQGEDFVFDITRFNPRYARQKNGGMKAEAVTGFFKRLRNNSGIVIGAHRFRHTFATALCNPPDDSQPDIFACQSILGHTSLQTTRGYVKTSMGRMDGAIKKLAPISSIALRYA